MLIPIEISKGRGNFFGVCQLRKDGRNEGRKSPVLNSWDAIRWRNMLTGEVGVLDTMVADSQMER